MTDCRVCWLIAVVAVAGAGCSGSAARITPLDDDRCQVQRLSVYCEQSACALTADTVTPVCDSSSDTTRYTNSCGGLTFEFGATLAGVGYYYFDPDGALIGVAQTGDIGFYCASGTSFTARYGTQCAQVGDAEDLCRSADAGADMTDGTAGNSDRTPR